MKITLDKGTEEKEVARRLKYWLSDNFWKGNLAEITLEGGLWN